MNKNIKWRRWKEEQPKPYSAIIIYYVSLSHTCAGEKAELGFGIIHDDAPSDEVYKTDLKHDTNGCKFWCYASELPMPDEKAIKQERKILKTYLRGPCTSCEKGVKQDWWENK